MSVVSIVTPDIRPKTTVATAAEIRARELDLAFSGLPTEDLIDVAVNRLFPGEIAVVSSFGAESAVLLDLVASISTAVPILFVDTGRHFDETLRHRDRLVERLGFTDVRVLGQSREELLNRDPDDWLWNDDPDACCALRKVEPLAHGMEGFSAWISGRKRFQAETRTAIRTFEADGARIKVNPLAAWEPEALVERARLRDLPSHPLVEKGYPSIGCLPCTSRVAPGEDPRSGRWRGRAKTECGIHLGLSAGSETDGSGI